MNALALAIALLLSMQDDKVAELQKKRDALGDKPTIEQLHPLAVEALDLGWPGLALMTKLTVECTTLDGNDSRDLLDKFMDKLRELAKDEKADRKKLADAVYDVLKVTESIGPAHPLGDLLAEYGDRSYIPKCCRELDENTHYGAKKGYGVFLNKWNDRRVARPMIDRLADDKEQHWVKVFCRSGLAAVSDPAAVPVYVYQLRSRGDKLPEDVRRLVLKALPDVVMRKNPEGLKRTEAMSYWDEAADKLRPEAKSLSEWTTWLNRVIELTTTDPQPPDPELDKKIEKLVDQLGDDDFETRESATNALIKLGDAVKARVLQAMNHKDPEVRGRASKIIASLEHIETAEGFVERNRLRQDVRFLVELLADPSKDVRARALERIKKTVGDKEKIDLDADSSDEARQKFIVEYRERNP